MKTGAKFPKEKRVKTLEIKNCTFSHIALKNVPKNFTLTVILSFKINGNGFKNNSFKRKVSEALLIKQIKPSLNVQEKSIELKLFN